MATQAPPANQQSSTMRHVHNAKHHITDFLDHVFENLPAPVRDILTFWHSDSILGSLLSQFLVLSPPAAGVLIKIVTLLGLASIVIIDPILAAHHVYYALLPGLNFWLRNADCHKLEYFILAYPDAVDVNFLMLLYVDSFRLLFGLALFAASIIAYLHYQNLRASLARPSRPTPSSPRTANPAHPEMVRTHGPSCLQMERSGNEVLIRSIEEPFVLFVLRGRDACPEACLEGDDFWEYLLNGGTWSLYTQEQDTTAG